MWLFLDIIFGKLLTWLGKKKNIGGRAAYVLALVLGCAITALYIYAKAYPHIASPSRMDRLHGAEEPPVPEEPRSRIRKAPAEPEPEPVTDTEQSDRWRNLPPLPGEPSE